MEIKIGNKKLDEEAFLKERAEVLALWPTGKEVNLEEAIEYHKHIPNVRRADYMLDEAKKKNYVTLFGRAGTPMLEDEIKLV